MKIPQAKWLAMGAASTIGITWMMPANVYVWTYSLVGIVVASLFLIFNNPRDEPDRYDIALCVPILTVMWPIIIFAMLLSKPWKEPEWKNRHEAAKKPDDRPSGLGEG